MNIFKMNLTDADKAIDNMLKSISKEQMVKDLTDAGFEIEECETYNIKANPYSYKDISSASIFKLFFGQVRRKKKESSIMEAA